MAEKQDWVQRRQRIVKCKIHGLSYDPEMTSGCARCRKEGLGVQPRSKPQLAVLLLAVLGMTVIAYRIIEAERAPPFPFDEPTAETPAITGDVNPAALLDPEPYRGTIQSVERALFETPGADLGDIGIQIAEAFRQLSRDLGDNAATNAQAQAALKAIADLANSAPETVSLGSIQNLRSGWAQLRNRHFSSAPWYVNHQGLDARTDRAALATYRSVADDLASLLGEGMDQVRTLTQPIAPNLATPDGLARKQEEWRTFQSSWPERIANLKLQLPARPDARATPEILAAAQRLEQAFSRTTSLSHGNPPSEDRLEDALGAVRKARQSFDDLLSR